MPSSLTHRSAASGVRTAIGTVAWLWQGGAAERSAPCSPLRAESALTLDVNCQLCLGMEISHLPGPVFYDRCEYFFLVI